jgi:hypothetical protein
LLSDLGAPQEIVVLHEDNQACIALSRNPQDQKRTKHIQNKFHYVRHQIKEKVFKLVYCPTRSQLADLFTKRLAGSKIREVLKALGVYTEHQSQGEC